MSGKPDKQMLLLQAIQKIDETRQHLKNLGMADCEINQTPVKTLRTNLLEQLGEHVAKLHEGKIGR